MNRDEYKDDNDDHEHFVKKPRLEECAADAVVSLASGRREKTLKRTAEHERMRNLLRKKNIKVIVVGESPENYLATASERQLLSWMQQFYGYNHHELWRL